jgi:Zn-finger nucleic acid-binding protein
VVRQTVHARDALTYIVPMQCPACGSNLVIATSGDNRFEECPACHGTWLDIQSFQKLASDFERQAAVLLRQHSRDSGRTQTLSHEGLLPCPRCRRPMQRYEYAGASGVHVDACREHGIWFDADELQGIIRFIQAGGLEQRRDRHGNTVAPPPGRSDGYGDVWFWWWEVLDLLLDIFILR